MSIKEEVRDREVKHRVPEELKPLIIVLRALRVNRTVRERALKPRLIGECKLESGLNLRKMLLTERFRNWGTILLLVVSFIGGDLQYSKSHLWAPLRSLTITKVAQKDSLERALFGD